jgi:hypothetical protein
VVFIAVRTRSTLIEALEYGSSVAYVLHWSAKGKRTGIGLGGRFFGVMTFAEGKLTTIVHLEFHER